MTESEIRDKLFSMRDEKYCDFQSKLIPTVEKERFIGIRTPCFRAFVKSLKDEDVSDFVNALPHYYYDENILHAFYIEKIKDYDECVKRLDEFLPYVDNWAVCDMMSPKILYKYPDKAIIKIKEWIASNETYKVRFAIGLLMGNYLSDNYKKEYSDLVAGVKSQEYYVNMMIAWYFATFLCKNWQAAIPYLTEKKLDAWTHNKTISKSCDSYRITLEQKEFLKSLRIKN